MLSTRIVHPPGIDPITGIGAKNNMHFIELCNEVEKGEEENTSILAQAHSELTTKEKRELIRYTEAPIDSK
eukprot:1159013-Pelagomonas_calceolata.AAC.5